jgi:hypothetical protein
MASDLYDSFTGKPEKTHVSSNQNPWEPQQSYLKKLFSEANTLQNRNFVSPFTSQGQNLISQRALSPDSLTGQSEKVIGDTISGQYLNPNTNPHLQSAVKDALGLAQSQMLGMYGGPAGQNINNSGFQEQLARNLGQVATNAYAGHYGQERQNQLNATGLAPQFDYSRGTALMNLGQQQEAQPWTDLSRYQAAITGNFGGTTNGELPYQSQLWNNMNNMAHGPFGFGNGPQLAQSGAQAAASFFSDVRLKENIEKIGTADAGYGIYRYNYKGDETPHIGVLAQEVEQIKPEAVGEAAGFKTVNYKMI